jgi:hypothetical protein
MNDINSRTVQFGMKISRGLKIALQAEAGRRGITVSALAFERLSEPWVPEMTAEELGILRSKTGWQVSKGDSGMKVTCLNPEKERIEQRRLDCQLSPEPEPIGPIEERRARAMAALEPITVPVIFDPSRAPSFVDPTVLAAPMDHCAAPTPPSPYLEVCGVLADGREHHGLCHQPIADRERWIRRDGKDRKRGDRGGYPVCADCEGGT